MSIKAYKNYLDYPSGYLKKRRSFVSIFGIAQFSRSQMIGFENQNAIFIGLVDCSPFELKYFFRLYSALRSFRIIVFKQVGFSDVGDINIQRLSTLISVTNSRLDHYFEIHLSLTSIESCVVDITSTSSGASKSNMHLVS